ncbi:hypothetical protein AU252_01475 [Pseudarthrobacter sulfonivorans]|uniref:Uncharacterized protein n=1 Tax=Pseudarthrobacter sulfonivorans TaxID=121292 RepID=A0A0U3P3T8_9MICC|nr:hypothetical protein AU252_01475 [Pseudarthrobacter sulfonivorans]
MRDVAADKLEKASLDRLNLNQLQIEDPGQRLAEGSLTLARPDPCVFRLHVLSRISTRSQKSCLGRQISLRQSPF